ncbi:MAG TPA: hypothetical protein VFH54_16915 [Mycobacteriales bacterium]|nr:hypothetical protein [Mycobacteriales bacterium]
MDDDAHDAEQRTVRAFVIKQRQDRWLRDLSRPMLKRRDTVRLYDRRDIDDRWVTPIPREDHTPRGLLDHLRRRGAPDQVWLMQAHEIAKRQTLGDAIEMVLNDAVSGVGGALVICIPGE